MAAFTVTKSQRERLAGYCRDEYYNDQYGPFPKIVEWLEQSWAAATDGHVLIGVRRDLVEGECEPVDAKVARILVGISEREPARPIDESALLAFVQGDKRCSRCRNERRVKCDTCRGSGRKICVCQHCDFPHDSDCDCEAGVVNCPKCSDGGRYGDAMGLHINTRLLRDAVAVVPLDGSPVNVAVGCKNESVLLVCRTARWFVVLMPLRKRHGYPIVATLIDEGKK
jgi:hypothetical protein